MAVLIAAGLFTILTCAACGGGGHHKSTPGTPVGNDDDAGSQACIDNDGDGFGVNCSAGSDCDDDDPTVTDECLRCNSPSKSCPCTPGTKSVACTPPPVRVEGGELVCHEGSRYCRDGAWGDCETIGQYVFVADP
ncbi:MAG TPA: hypothetical protein VGI70_10965 [Polyangiales bacterium]